MSAGLLVDLFAGGGGASLGIERALGRPVDVAINHSVEAIEMHAANHPRTRHFREDVWKANPLEVCAGEPVDLLWLSPDCRHHSRAKGGKPVEKKIRSLAWVAVRWAKAVRPRVIALENVQEFQKWGPLLDDDRPCPLRKGKTFRNFVARLVNLGYDVDWRVLNAADFGAPTHRRRLFLVARCDGQPIEWPTPTHGPNRSRKWRAAAEIIDWSLPCPSIFERKRPLAEATMRRIAAGLRRFVLECPEPFIVSGYGEREGQAPRYGRVDQPLGAVVASGKHCLVSPHIQQFFGGMVGKDVREPLPTVTAWDHNGLCAAWLEKFYGTARGSDVRLPMPTVTADGGHIAEVRAFIVKYFGACEHGQSLRDPLHTATSKARFGLVAIGGQDYQVVDIGLRMLTPRELARAQGFPESYALTGTKTSQVARIGNAVCPDAAEAVVRANFGRREVEFAGQATLRFGGAS